MISCGPIIYRIVSGNWSSCFSSYVRKRETDARRTFPTQYATNIAAAVQLFFVAPATFAMPMLMIRLTTGPKNPMIV